MIDAGGWGGRIGAALVAVMLAAAPAAGSAPRTTAAPLYPVVGAGTAFLDHASLLGDVPEKAWYEGNIPFVDLPDEDVEDTYYYRWRTFKEALKYTGPKDGWIVTEFLGPVGYSAPFGGINAAAGHHIYEGRWLRDPRYLDDYVDYWLTGSGAGAKPATEGLNDNATDWAHQYSFWAVDAAVARAEVSGDWRFVLDRLPQLTKQYETWKASNFDAARGIYWQVPVWDAMEFTAGSYQTEDPYHGGDGFRPTLNAYQYGDARALAALLRKKGDAQAARRYDREADALRTKTQQQLWDGDFYKHVQRDETAPIEDRELMGYVPWYFHMPPTESAVAWAQLTDPQGFAAPFGPTTAERRSPWFMHEALNGCCRWNGPSWPFATSQTLTGLANQLLDYPAQSYVSKSDYQELLRRYAVTQRRNGRPYVAEAHHPDEDRWLYDGRGHSEDYNHSTFTDLVLSGLLGIRPQQDDTVRIAPLNDYDHFAVENLAYHGHNLSVLWDSDGSAYGRGAGFRVFVDGRQVLHRPTPGDVTVRVGTLSSPQPELVDDAANAAETGYPAARASYTWSADRAADAIDGQDFHLDVPSTRWTSYGSPHASNHLEVDLGAATVVSDVRVVFYDDGGGVRTPPSFALQYQAADGTWQDVPGQTRSPAQPVGRDVNRIVVDPPLTTDRLRVVAPGVFGITALQLWRAPDQRISLSLPPTLAVDPGTQVTVRGSVRASVAVPDARVSLEVPRGWTVTPVTAPPRVLRAGVTYDVAWQVGVPADADPSAGLPLRVLARTGAGVTSALTTTTYEFDPADYPVTAWDDDFGTDRLASYRVDHPVAEPSPALRVADGALTADATARAFAVLAAPVATDPGGTAVIVEPRAFSGASPEDSLFTGLSGGSGDNALAWYNNHHRTSGADVQTGGRARPEATGGCCANVTWEPGDRFAVLARWGRLTTWVEHDGRWAKVHDAPVSAAVDGATLASWSPAFGVRLDAGTLTVDRVTVLHRS
ncbi:MGH1-like glycoside hydrolase domain-containing protein [Catenuloplanes japonicus]|uniref:MGH1-like glycoside hydrolase domain-containing protein n=1 Tax=Catenuloplanes japonicus TaxID=33876 RepID=UPI0006899A85|nr:discoidin domain-containing protein [Catenuloplanes japonicus]